MEHVTCTQCGRALDAQALELGACRYCGHAITSAGTINISPADATGADSPPTGATPPFDVAQSRYDWKDWPTASAPPAGGTRPTLPKVGDFPEDAASGGTASSNAPTLPGSRFFAPPAATPPGTAPFGVSTPPADASAPPGPQARLATPAAGVSTPPRQPPGAPGRRGHGRLLALAGLLAIALIILITGGFLFARGFNKSSAGASSTRVISTAQSTATPTPRPTTAPTAQPTGTSTPAPSPTSTAIPLQTYPGGLFTIGYPNGWTHKNISIPISLPFPLNGVQFSSGAPELTVATGKELPGTPGSIATLADDLLLTWQGVAPPRTSRMVTIGGKNWIEKMGNSSMGDHIVVASISLNGYLYSLIYGAPVREFSSYDMQAFMPMLQSFLFGSG